MTLASRLSGFFLAALAIVLVGFSSALFVLANDHLQRQVDERLNAALATLAAAAEIGPDGVEWEPDERVLGLGRDAGADQVRWVVWDDHGGLIDRSANLNSRRLVPQAPTGLEERKIRGRDGRGWRLLRRRLSAASFPGSPNPGGAAGSSGQPEGERGHRTLDLVAYVPLGPTEATLRSLGVTLTALSVGLWLVAALIGRRLCRRALAPLTRMAVAARDADAAEPGHRLPLPATRDELEDLGLAFNSLLDRLHEALERQRRFTGDASHQLRTPLTGLLGQVDVALRRERTLEEYRRVLEMVRSRGGHLRQIVESLLFLARAEAETERPNLQPIDLATWVPEHLRDWSSHPRAADLHLAQDEPGSFLVRVHPPLLSQLVDNLLDNASKYSPDGTPIVVRLRREPGVVVLAVEDGGCGLSADQLDQVFEPFYRSPETRSRTGVGLGLAVARRIVTAFGGSIRVESEPGVGSRFEIQLPESTDVPVQREPRHPPTLSEAR
jgi:two-component system, OmpR family, sensor kinase